MGRPSLRGGAEAKAGGMVRRQPPAAERPSQLLKGLEARAAGGSEGQSEGETGLL